MIIVLNKKNTNPNGKNKINSNNLTSLSGNLKNNTMKLRIEFTCRFTGTYLFVLNRCLISKFDIFTKLPRFNKNLS